LFDIVKKCCILISAAKKCIANYCLIFKQLPGEKKMKDSTALILTSVCFNILTIWAVIISAPVAGIVALAGAGAALLGFGFYNMANDN
jgi:hypothetical protein